MQRTSLVALLGVAIVFLIYVLQSSSVVNNNLSTYVALERRAASAGTSRHRITSQPKKITAPENSRLQTDSPRADSPRPVPPQTPRKQSVNNLLTVREASREYQEMNWGDVLPPVPVSQPTAVEWLRKHVNPGNNNSLRCAGNDASPMTDMTCEEVRRCVRQYIGRDTRTRETMMTDALRRSVDLANLVFKHQLTENRLRRLMKDSTCAARYNMFEINDGEVKPLRKSADVLRVPHFIKFLEALVKHPHYSKLLPKRTILPVDTSDRVCGADAEIMYAFYHNPQHPGGGIFGNFLLPDETFYYKGSIFMESYFDIREKVAKGHGGQLDKMMQRDVWDRRRPSFVFAGSPTSKVRDKVISKFKTYRAQKLVEVQYGFSYGAKAKTKHQPVETFGNYKGSLMIVGKSASQRDKMLMLLGTAIYRPVWLQAEPMNFLHDLIHPYVHYMPVWYVPKSKKNVVLNLSESQCTLEDMLVRDNADLGYAMARNAFHVANIMDADFILEYTARVIALYHEKVLSPELRLLVESGASLTELAFPGQTAEDGARA